MHIMNGLVQWDCNLPGSKTWWEAFAVSSKWILCITTEALIPLILAIFQPIASLCSWSILINWCSQKSSNFGGLQYMGMGMKKVDKGPLLVASYQYLREEHNPTMHWPPPLIFQYPNCNQKGLSKPLGDPHNLIIWKYHGVGSQSC